MSEFEEVFEDALTETVEVQTLLGTGANGPMFSATLPVAGLMVERVERMVRTTSGDDKASDTTLYMDNAKVDHFTNGSQVLYRGEKRVVIKRNILDVFGLPAHSVVYLG